MDKPLHGFERLLFFLLFYCFVVSPAVGFGQDEPAVEVEGTEQDEPEPDGLIARTANTLLKHHPTRVLGKPHTINLLPLGYWAPRTGINLGFRMDLQSREFRPFRYRLQLQILASLKGSHKHALHFEFPEGVAGYGLHVMAEWERDLEARYYGLGNNSLREKQLLDKNSPNFIDEDFYVNNLKRPRIAVHGTRVLLPDLRLWLGLGYEYVQPQLKKDAETSFLGQEEPFGYFGGWGSHLSFRLHFDNRNNNLFPDKGMVSEISYEPNFARVTEEPAGRLERVSRSVVFHRITFSDAHFTRISNSGFIFANRFAFEVIAGDAPYYAFGEIAGERETRSIGGSTSLRGFKSRRFQDKVRMITLSEVRYSYRKFSFFSNDFRIIFTAFVDNGRVWHHISNVSLQGFHTTFGFGGWLNWNDNMIIRLDIGRSPEGFVPYFRLHSAF